MKIRTRLVLLLLVFGLGPLAVFVLSDRVATQQLTGELGDQASTIVSERTSDTLVALVSAAADRALATRRAAETLVAAQAEIVQEALHEAPREIQPDAVTLFERSPLFRVLLPGSPLDDPRRVYQILTAESPVDAHVAVLRETRPLLERIVERSRLRGAEHAVVLTGSAALGKPDARLLGQTAETVGGWESIDPNDRGDGWRLLPEPGRAGRLLVVAVIYDRDGTRAGAVAAALPVESLIAGVAPTAPLVAQADLALLAAGPDMEPIVAASADTGRAAAERVEASLRQLSPEQRRAILRRVVEASPDRFDASLNNEDARWVLRPLLPGVALVAAVPSRALSQDADALQRDLRRRTREQLNTLVVASLLLVPLVLVAAYGAAKTMTVPLRRILETVDRMFEHRPHDEPTPDAPKPVRATGEVGRLARAVGKMADDLGTHVKLQESASVARQLGEHLLPKSTPDIPGFEIAARSVFSARCGGDYHDFLTAPQMPGTPILVGDVAGDGLPAALFLASSRAAIHAHAETADSPAALLEMANDSVLAHASHGRFFCLLCMTVETEDRESPELAWASAGAELPIVVTPGDDEPMQLVGGELPLGVDQGTRYQTRTADAPPPGSIVYLGTDGLRQTRGPTGEAFGAERIAAVIRANLDASPETIADALVEAADAYADETDHPDDITFVVLKRIS
ncbi:MAG: PP2C family protein-serine/threonine phosphatase [Planctomycetota bacterium]